MGDNENNFKFTLTQGNIILFERIIDSSNFSQHTRGHVDIRKILPLSINMLQKVLSKNNYTTRISVDSDKLVDETVIKGKSYDLLDEYIKDINSFPANIRYDIEYNPESVTFKVDVNTPRGIESMTIRGVECKIALYRNDSPIVERLFYVDRYNPSSRWSLDLTNTCEYISKNILNSIKNSDISYLWSEYDKLYESSDLLIIE